MNFATGSIEDIDTAQHKKKAVLYELLLTNNKYNQI